MERNSEFTGEFTYDIDSGSEEDFTEDYGPQKIMVQSGSEEDFTEDYGPQDKRSSGFHKR